MRYVYLLAGQICTYTYNRLETAGATRTARSPRNTPRTDWSVVSRTLQAQQLIIHTIGVQTVSVRRGDLKMNFLCFAAFLVRNKAT